MGYHRSVLSAEFNTALMLVLQREVVLRETYGETAGHLPSLQCLIQSRSLTAAGIVSSFLHLQTCGLLHHIPSSLLALLLPATIVHLLQSSSSKLASAGESNFMTSYQQCLILLRLLRQDQPVVQQWISSLEKVAANLRYCGASTSDLLTPISLAKRYESLISISEVPTSMAFSVTW